MASNQELELQVANLTRILLERDEEAARTKAAALEAQQKAEAAADLATRAAARKEEVQKIRHGAWAAFLLGQVENKSKPLDLASLNIPAEGWPPGTSESDYGLAIGVTKVPTIDTNKTLLGQLRRKNYAEK